MGLVDVYNYIILTPVIPCYEELFTAAKAPLKRAYDAACATAKRCAPEHTCYKTNISALVRAFNNAFFKIKDANEKACKAEDNVRFENAVGFMRVWSGLSGNGRTQQVTAALAATLT